MNLSWKYRQITLKKPFHLHKNEHFVCVSFCILTKCLFTVVDIVVMYFFLRSFFLSLWSLFVVFLIHVQPKYSRIYELLYFRVFESCFVCVIYIYIYLYQDANTVITRPIFDLCLAQLFIRPIYIYIWIVVYAWCELLTE